MLSTVLGTRDIEIKETRFPAPILGGTSNDCELKRDHSFPWLHFAGPSSCAISCNSCNFNCFHVMDRKPEAQQSEVVKRLTEAGILAALRIDASRASSPVPGAGWAGHP